MTIQFNTDKTISAEERHQDFFTTQVAHDLKRFEDHITRIEVHLKDENGKKEGVNDINCVLEARLEGRTPIAVSKQADSIELALSGAIAKLKSSLETIIGKSQNH